jgi:hypothetical protein
MSKWPVLVVAPLLGVSFVLSGVLALGQQARHHLRGQERYRIAFRAIDCPAPDGLTRDEFLGEVQSVASWPDDVGLLDDRVAARLGQAFAAHPWVEEVRRVEVASDRHVRVDLLFRTPVLSVPTRSRTDGSLVHRGVDGQGVLLPRSAADAARKPVLVGEIPTPTVRAGMVWDDAHVQTAVRTAVFLRPHAEQLGLECFEFTGEELVIQARQGRVVWGRPPGDERPDEAPAEVKLQRLLDTGAPRPDVRSLPEIDTRVVKSK